MSGTLTPYGRRQILTAGFITDLYAPPASLWLAYTGDIPTSNSDGSELDERPGLVRVEIGALTSANWGLTDYAEVYNLAVLTFPDVTADTGLIGGWAVVDSDVIGDGVCWMVGTQIEPFTLDTGDTPPAVDVAGLACGLYD